MVSSSLLSKSTSIPTKTHSIIFPPKPTPFHTSLKPKPKPKHFSPISNKSSPNTQNHHQQPLRTLYPGGFKRPEIKVPTIVLQVEPDEVLGSGGADALDQIDTAVSGQVGVVVLDGGQGSGGRLYEAACLLKSLVRDRAYFMVAERVDIAAAVAASGVVLSDQGLPAIVARKTMMESKSESVVLPLVAKNVQSSKAALNASNSEGADFLIYNIGGGDHTEAQLKSVLENVKIPVFVSIASQGDKMSHSEALELVKSGASGLVISVEELKFFRENVNRFLSGTSDELQSREKLKIFDDNGSLGEKGTAGFIKLEERERQFIERERVVLLEAIDVIQRAAPLREEVSLLVDAVAQLDEPFLLVIVGEFNSGKSTFINALLGRRYLKDGVVPTTNEITFLRYSKVNSVGQQRCERQDGQYICYLPAPILEEMIIVDTPGTNVILQRQQRLTEEFVPRADLLLFVLSADRPLTESEVEFLRYTQQWKKKVVFVLNKADIYRTTSELEEAVGFIKENTQKLLNTEHVTLFPVSARSTLEEKLGLKELSVIDSPFRTNSFPELEKFLYSFLDGSTVTGMERMKLKLGTPIAIAERLLSASEAFVSQECRYAKADLDAINEVVDSVSEYARKMESESIPWRKKVLSLIDTTKARAVRLIESTLRLSNLDLVASYVSKGERSASVPSGSSIQNDIIGPALDDAKELLAEYMIWLQSNNAREGKQYTESFEERWPSLASQHNQVQFETYESLRAADEVSVQVIDGFSPGAASKLFEQEIREVFLGAFGGLGAAGLSASLLTSVLPTTLEDLLALALCSAGGFVAISNFPARRQKMAEKVKKVADGLARQVEEAMEKDLSCNIENLEKFVTLIAKPYQDAAQQRLDILLQHESELTNVQKKLQNLQNEIQSLHISSSSPQNSKCGI